MGIILASKSPRRKEIMDMLMWEYEIITENIEETIDDKLSLEENIMNLAFKKANVVAIKNKNDYVIGADTIVYANNKILGKPKNDEDSRYMLRLISSEPHYVYTGVSILNISKGIDIRFFEKTKIVMSEMTEEEIDWYIKTREGFGKAGSYAIQGKGGIFIKEIEGDYYNVMGLPINRLYRELKNIM